MPNVENKRVWTVAEAKARLSETLRLAEEEGPQRIGTRKSFVVSACLDLGGKDTAPQASGQMAGGEHSSRHEPRSAEPQVEP